MDPSHGLYLFCVARSAVLAPAEFGLTADAPLRMVSRQGLQAVVCEVLLADWIDDAGEAHLQDLQWLGPRAVRHEWVIKQVMTTGGVLPLRFGCIFSGEESLGDWLERNHKAIGEYLDSIGNRQEWSLKGWLHTGRATAALAATDSRLTELPSAPGARYLREQKLRQELLRSAREWAREAGKTAIAALWPEIASQRTLGIRAASAADREEEQAFNYALLVAPADLAALEAKVQRLDAELRPRGLELALSGPWPPFSFCPSLPEFVDDALAETARYPALKLE